MCRSAPALLPNGKGADGLIDSPAEHAEGLALLAGDAHKAGARHRKLAGTQHRAQLRIGQPVVELGQLEPLVEDGCGTSDK